MKTIVKYAAAAALTGALALAAVTPSQARHGRNAAIIGGFVAGAVVGAAATGAAADGYYYNDGYYNGPGPGYAYEPGYVDEGAYAYEPAPAYQYRRYPNRSCAVDMGYGRYDYTGC